MASVRLTARTVFATLICGLLTGWTLPAAFGSFVDDRGEASTQVHPPSPILVGLGDSYASGLGTRLYLPRSGACRRSPAAYPALLAKEHSWRLRFTACSGATATTVRREQLYPLSRRTDSVTVGTGGNDAGFAHVLVECAKPWWISDCGRAVNQARAEIRQTLPRRLNHLYSAITGRASRAEVVVVGYPRLFNGEDCNAGTFFSPREERWLNDTADLLDVTLARRAAAHDFAFADPRPSFESHAVCDRTAWLNGLSDPVAESYHPNRRGQRALADLVDRLRSTGQLLGSRVTFHESTARERPAAVLWAD